MPKTQLIIRKVLEGRIVNNDRYVAEIETFGTEGFEKQLRLNTLQIHREDTNDTVEGFRRRFPVGTWGEHLHDHPRSPTNRAAH